MNLPSFTNCLEQIRWYQFLTKQTSQPMMSAFIYIYIYKKEEEKKKKKKKKKKTCSYLNIGYENKNN